MNKQKSVGIVGAAVKMGQPEEGVSKGANAIKSELNRILKDKEITVTDYGTIKQPGEREPEPVLNCLNQQAFIKTSHELADMVERSVAENDLTFVLGGDHSLAYGSIKGQFRAFKNSFVVWVDAHADLNTPNVTESGNIHGMPVAFLLHETNEKVPNSQGFEEIHPVMTAKNLLYIGLRDVDTPELRYLKEFNIRYFRMDEIHEIGMENVLQITTRAIYEQPNSFIHLSFDIDALDPEYAASTGTPVPGGLTLEEGKLICKTLARTGLLKAVDIAEVNPELSTEEDSARTIAAAVELLKSCLDT